MAHRIEVSSLIPDARAHTRKKDLERLGFLVQEVALADVYTVDTSLSPEHLTDLASMLIHPVIEQATLDQPQAPEHFDFALEVGFLPGVTDNVGSTVQQSLEDRLGIHASVFSSQVTYISGSFSQDQLRSIAEALANPVISHVRIKDHATFQRDHGMGVIVPRVRLESLYFADVV